MKSPIDRTRKPASATRSDASAPVTPFDTIIEHYMQNVDRTLLRRNLTLTYEQRLEQLQELVRFAEALKHAREKAGQ